MQLSNCQDSKQRLLPWLSQITRSAEFADLNNTNNHYKNSLQLAHISTVYLKSVKKSVFRLHCKVFLSFCRKTPTKSAWIQLCRTVCTDYFLSTFLLQKNNLFINYVCYYPDFLSANSVKQAFPYPSKKNLQVHCKSFFHYWKDSCF